MKINDSAGDIPGELRLGKWHVWLHEWADHAGVTPEQWRERVRAACELDGVDCEMVVIQRFDLTVVFNREAGKRPEFEQLRESIDELLAARWRAKH